MKNLHMTGTGTPGDYAKRTSTAGRTAVAFAYELQLLMCSHLVLKVVQLRCGECIVEHL